MKHSCQLLMRHIDIGFKQYNPRKLAKYGLLYQTACNCSIPYTNYSLPFAGKLEKVEGPAAKYYIHGTDEYSKYLTSELSVYCNLQGINISMDHYFTSGSMASQALEKNTIIEGTMKHNRNGIPTELKQVADREERRWPLNELVFIIDSSVQGGGDGGGGGGGGHKKRKMKKIEISTFKK